MESNQDRPYVDPSIESGDQGTEPWAEGEPPDPTKQKEPSPADQFTGDTSAGLDGGSAEEKSDESAS